MSGEPIPAWWRACLVVLGLLLLRDTYKALRSGVVYGGRRLFGDGTSRYYERVTQPGSFWFCVILHLVGVAACIGTGLGVLFAR